MEAVTVKSDICWNDDDVTTEIHGDEWEMENIEKKAAVNVQNCAVIVFFFGSVNDSGGCGTAAVFSLG